jgi:hypothetical protein
MRSDTVLYGTYFFLSLIYANSRRCLSCNLHWESQAAATQSSKAGQNYIHFKERGYTILFFVRLEKRCEGETAPFIFIGPAARLFSYEGNRPISLVWELEHAVPAGLFAGGRVG